MLARILHTAGKGLLEGSVGESCIQIPLSLEDVAVEVPEEFKRAGGIPRFWLESSYP